VINKADLAPNVGTSLYLLQRDACAQRGGRPFAFASLRHVKRIEEVASFIREPGGL
jgi:urease accessory protein